MQFKNQFKMQYKIINQTELQSDIIIILQLKGCIHEVR